MSPSGLLVLLAGVYSPMLIGAAIMKLLNKDKENGLSWITLLVGVAAAFLLGLIPLVGWLILFVFYLTAIGAVAGSFFNFLMPKEK